MAPSRRFGIVTVAVFLATLLPLTCSASIPQQELSYPEPTFGDDVEMFVASQYGMFPENMYGDPAEYPAARVPGGGWWLEHIKKQGVAAYSDDPCGYKVFRNVRDYGATGDGVTDDTDAINAAIRDGKRCGKGCDSSTITPALVYFPPGTYSISKPIVAMYYSQLVGNPIDRPVIKGMPIFSGIALIDSDPYEPDGSNWYTNQNNFFRAIRNMIIDTTDMPLAAGTGLHWQVAQATSLINIKFIMSEAPGNLHQGIFMDNGSGGFMSDLEFIGGKFGAWVGNQQFMTRNLRFRNCQTALYINWDWQWTFKSIDIGNCEVGIDFSQLNNDVTQGVGSIIILDSKIWDTPIGLKTSRSDTSTPISGGSAVLDNVALSNVGQAVTDKDGGTILEGGTGMIDLWGQGRTYNPDGFISDIQGDLQRPFPKPLSLLDSNGKIFERSRPQYINLPVTNFISVRDHGAKGDGQTDDTEALRDIFQTFAGDTDTTKNIIYFDHGIYVVSDTIDIPVNTRIVGELWAVIMANGEVFQDRNHPVPVWRVGQPGDVGIVEIQELIFQTKGPQPGAILMEWNSRDPDNHKGANALWDVHFRVAGSRGTDLEVAQCMRHPEGSNSPDPKCEGAFMLLHIAKTASVYIENCWAWASDHALDRPFEQITIYNGRGILSESEEGPVWMYAAASEHNTLYQYQIQSSKNVFMATIQSETPYFQSNPGAQAPFFPMSEWNDPDYSECTTSQCSKSWALRILNSEGIMIYGAGLYSFFDNYEQECIKERTCQDSIVDIQDSPDTVLWNLNTIASSSMLDLNKVKLIDSGENLNTFCQTIMQFSTFHPECRYDE